MTICTETSNYRLSLETTLSAFENRDYPHTKESIQDYFNGMQGDLKTIFRAIAVNDYDYDKDIADILFKVAKVYVKATKFDYAFDSCLFDEINLWVSTNITKLNPKDLTLWICSFIKFNIAPELINSVIEDWKKTYSNKLAQSNNDEVKTAFSEIKSFLDIMPYYNEKSEKAYLTELSSCLLNILTEKVVKILEVEKTLDSKPFNIPDDYFEALIKHDKIIPSILFYGKNSTYIGNIISKLKPNKLKELLEGANSNSPKSSENLFKALKEVATSQLNQRYVTNTETLNEIIDRVNNILLTFKASPQKVQNNTILPNKPTSTNDIHNPAKPNVQDLIDEYKNNVKDQKAANRWQQKLTAGVMENFDATQLVELMNLLKTSKFPIIQNFWPAWQKAAESKIDNSDLLKISDYFLNNKIPLTKKFASQVYAAANYNTIKAQESKPTNNSLSKANNITTYKLNNSTPEQLLDIFFNKLISNELTGPFFKDWQSAVISKIGSFSPYQIGFIFSNIEGSGALVDKNFLDILYKYVEVANNSAAASNYPITSTKSSAAKAEPEVPNNQQQSSSCDYTPQQLTQFLSEVKQNGFNPSVFNIKAWQTAALYKLNDFTPQQLIMIFDHFSAYPIKLDYVFFEAWQAAVTDKIKSFSPKDINSICGNIQLLNVIPNNQFFETLSNYKVALNDHHYTSSSINSGFPHGNPSNCDSSARNSNIARNNTNPINKITKNLLNTFISNYPKLHYISSSYDWQNNTLSKLKEFTSEELIKTIQYFTEYRKSLKYDFSMEWQTQAIININRFNINDINIIIRAIEGSVFIPRDELFSALYDAQYALEYDRIIAESIEASDKFTKNNSHNNQDQQQTDLNNNLDKPIEQIVVSSEEFAKKDYKNGNNQQIGGNNNLNKLVQKVNEGVIQENPYGTYSSQQLLSLLIDKAGIQNNQPMDPLSFLFYWQDAAYNYTGSYGARQLSIILHNLGKFGIPLNEKFLHRLQISANSKINDFGPQDLTHSLLAFVKFGMKPEQEFFNKWLEVAASKIKLFSINDLSNSLHALGHLKLVHKIDINSEQLKDIVNHINERIPQEYSAINIASIGKFYQGLSIFGNAGSKDALTLLKNDVILHTETIESKLQKGIFNIIEDYLKETQYACHPEKHIEKLVGPVDIAIIEKTTGKVQLVIQVDGPHHFTNLGNANPSTNYNTQIIKQVCHLPLIRFHYKDINDLFSKNAVKSFIIGAINSELNKENIYNNDKYQAPNYSEHHNPNDLPDQAARLLGEYDNNYHDGVGTVYRTDC